MDRDSDFEKELELEVVDEPDEADLLLQELLQDKNVPSRIRDVVKPRKAGYGDNTALPKVDTLREEEDCPYGMGSNDCGLSDGSCDVCGYEALIEGLDDPDLSKAKKLDQMQEEQENRKKKRMNEESESPSKLPRPRRPFDSKTAKAKSKSQFRLMKGICEGNIDHDTIDKKTACEFVKNHQSPKGLPEKVKNKKSSIQQVHFLYELVGNGFIDIAEKYIQDEIDAGRADSDLMDAYAVLQFEGPEAFREYVFKSDPLGVDMVEQLYGDDSPEDNPDPMEIIDRKNRYERNYQKEFGPRGRRPPPATPGNWIPGR